MTQIQDYAMQMAKDIVVAKLSTSAPGRTNDETGDNIARMYESIYNKIYEIASKDEAV